MIAAITHIISMFLHSRAVTLTEDQRTVELRDEVCQVQHADQGEMASRLVQQLLLLLDGWHAVRNGTRRRGWRD